MSSKLTAKENLFAIARAYGKTQVETYKDAGYSFSSPQTMSVEASKIEHRPHVKECIKQLRSELNDEQKTIYIWNRERTTGRIITLMDRIESDKKLFSRHSQTVLSCITELNKIHKVQEQITDDQKIQIIIGRVDPDMPNDTADLLDD